LNRLAARIARFVDTSLEGRPSEPLDDLLLEVSAWQRAHDPVASSLVDGPVTHWTEIPAVPVGVFQELPVGTVGPEEPAVTFHTSGTTTSRPGVHRLRSTALYDQGALAWARRVVPGMPQEIVALLGSPSTHPHSSLSHMVALLGRCSWHVEQGVLDAEGASQRVHEAKVPLLVATTAFALAEWLDHEPPALPPGSVVFVTGGFKGRQHALQGPALYASLRSQLRPSRVVTEYGMTELSSQLWGTPELAYLPPPWLKVVAADPVSGRILPVGEAGQLRFYDLCNLDSTVGIETMDVGELRPDGTVWLQGRLVGAPPRGCSLTVEEVWARRG
jgi:hypothetical protein